jgi:hypothetical protein
MIVFFKGVKDDVSFRNKKVVPGKGKAILVTGREGP